jgi:hypothetical protein
MGCFHYAFLLRGYAFLRCRVRLSTRPTEEDFGADFIQERISGQLSHFSSWLAGDRIRAAGRIHAAGA